MLVHPVAGLAESAVRRLCASGGTVPRPPAWQAIYFYEDVPDEALLCDVLMPTMVEALARDRIDAFFFIRYWEDGYHIRLRFRSDHPEVLELLRNCGRDGSGGPSVRPGAYEPETERYGGPGCIGICEGHFLLSSMNVWYRLRPNLALSPEDLLRRVRLPRAAHDMMMVVGNAYREPESSAAFLRDYWLSWLIPPRERGAQRARGIREDLEGEMDRQFKLIGDGLKDHLLGAWHQDEDLQSEDGEVSGERGDPSHAEWLAGTSIVLEALRREGLEFAGPAGRRVVSSLIHMNNNRFGVSNRDEAFLAYVCERALRESCA